MVFLCVSFLELFNALVAVLALTSTITVSSLIFVPLHGLRLPSEEDQAAALVGFCFLARLERFVYERHWRERTTNLTIREGRVDEEKKTRRRAHHSMYLHCWWVLLVVYVKRISIACVPR